MPGVRPPPAPHLVDGNCPPARTRPPPAPPVEPPGDPPPRGPNWVNVNLRPAGTAPAAASLDDPPVDHRRPDSAGVEIEVGAWIAAPLAGDERDANGAQVAGRDRARPDREEPAGL